MGRTIAEIVDSVTGRISIYPADSDEFHSMRTQIDWQRLFHPDYRLSYRFRYEVDANNATATEFEMEVVVG